MTPSFRRGSIAALVTTTLAAAGPASLRGQGFHSENEIGVFVGGWLGEDFYQASIGVTDPVLGTIDYSSALNQNNAVMIGAHYTGYFSRWLGVDISAAYVAGKWTTEGGRNEGGILTGDTNVISGVTTIPMALNLIVRAPTPNRLPRPFVTAGLGGVFFKFAESNAPLTIPATVGTPLDTVLFDLKLGLRLAPNVGAGVIYAVTDRIGIRAEGRVWATMINERITDTTFTQRNTWIMASAVFRL